MTDAVGQVVPNGAGGPPADPEAAKYDALRKELGITGNEDAGGDDAPAEVDADLETVEAKAPVEPAESPHVPRAEHENLFKALAAEREQRRAAEAREQAIIKLARDTLAQNRQAEPKKDEPAKIPSEQEDPIGHFKALYAQQQAKIDALERGSQQSSQQLQEQIQRQQAHSIAVASEAEIVKTRPDYWDACQHLERMRAAQLNAMFPDNSPHVMAYAQSQGFNSVQEMKIAALENDRSAVLMHAIGMGASPAELYYSLAQQAGYQAKANGKAPDADKAKAQLQAVKKGRAASVSISGGGAGKGAENMSIADLTDMFDDDPDAAMKTFRKMGEMGLLG